MDIQYVLVSVAFGICSVLSIIRFLHILQKANFSFIELFTIQKKDLRNNFLSLFTVITWLLLFGYIIVVFDDSKTDIYHIVISIFYFLELLFWIKKQKTTYFTSPFLRLKTFILFIVTNLLIIVLYFFPVVDPYVWLLILDRLIFVLVSIGVIALAFPSEVYADYLVQKAMGKIGKRKDIFTIFVMGKDNKKVVQEIASVLSEKYIVSTNTTQISNMQLMAEVLLKKIKTDTEVFITSVESLSRKDMKILNSFFSLHSVVLTTMENDTIHAKNVLKEIEKSCLVIADYKNSENLKKITRTHVVFYADNKEDITTKNSRVLLYTQEKLSTRTFYSFDIYCNEAHLMKLKIPQAILIEKKLFLPGIYLAFGLDMTIHMVKQAYKRRNLL